MYGTYPGGIGKYRDRRSFRCSKGKPSEGTRRSHAPIVQFTCCMPVLLTLAHRERSTQSTSSDSHCFRAQTLSACLDKAHTGVGKSVAVHSIGSLSLTQHSKFASRLWYTLCVSRGSQRRLLGRARSSFQGPGSQMSSPGQATDQASLLLSKQLRGELCCCAPAAAQADKLRHMPDNSQI